MTMGKYIAAVKAAETISEKTGIPLSDLVDIFAEIPAADVAPVVRCKDCEYSYDEISYLCCSHGVCVDCEVPPSFYCAYGKRRAEKEPPEEGEI